ncbi:MAG: hypothetical protein I8H77_04475 [Comamonadaceae bacterium]|nr:hypothetical protein [Comamonadaceae bacterium]
MKRLLPDQSARPAVSASLEVIARIEAPDQKLIKCRSSSARLSVRNEMLSAAARLDRYWRSPQMALKTLLWNL